MSLRPVDRIKHVVDAEGSVTATQSVIDLIEAKDAPVKANPNEVQTGSTVNGIYLKVEVSHTSGVGRPNIYLAIFKNPGANLTPPNANTMGASDNKRYSIHQEMVMNSGDAGNGLPRILFNGVIAIPKGYRRMGPNDKLQLLLRSPTVTSDFCMQCHYKEFR